MNRDRPTIPDRGKRQRAVQECEQCGKRFEIYHLTDRFCSQRCRNHYWNIQRAIWRREYMREHVGMRLQRAGNMPPEFVREMDLDLGKFENPRQIEPRPDFATETVHKTEWPEQWQCVHCERRWPNSTLYCDCPESDKAPSDDF